MRHIKRDSLRTKARFGMTPQLNRKESFYGEGFVELRPFDIVDGEKVFRTDEFSKHNLIVKKGRASMIDLLIGASTKKLKYIRWGKGGALAYPAGDPLQPLAVDDNDQDVSAFLIDKPLSAPLRVSDTVVTYTETLISDEVNNDVNEAGMMFEESDLSRTIFARITFPTLRLTNDRGTGVEITWTFNFTRAEEA